MKSMLSCIVGSTCLGVQMEGTDDRDEMHICYPTRRQVVGLDQPIWSRVIRSQPEGVRSQPGDVDAVYHSVKKWLGLAMKGNPTMVIPLFLPMEFILYEDMNGWMLRNLKAAMVCKKWFYPFRGYMIAQKERLIGTRGGMRVNRPELIEKYGYDVKYAYHVIRLAMQGCELLSSGNLTLPMRVFEREILMKIRTGVFSWSAMTEMLEWCEMELGKAFEKSELRMDPDEERINKTLESIHTSALYLPVEKEGSEDANEYQEIGGEG